MKLLLTLDVGVSAAMGLAPLAQGDPAATGGDAKAIAAKYYCPQQLNRS